VLAASRKHCQVSAGRAVFAASAHQAPLGHVLRWPRLANDEADREMERGAGPLDFEAGEAAYSETSADELDRFRAAIAGLPANLVREFVARFEEAQQDDGA
jgi:hypothetical protein